MIAAGFIKNGQFKYSKEPWCNGIFLPKLILKKMMAMILDKSPHFKAFLEDFTQEKQKEENRKLVVPLSPKGSNKNAPFSVPKPLPYCFRY